jgi:hypothetical protein
MSTENIDTTYIDTKADNEDSENKNDLKGFIIDMLRNFITIIIYAWLGSSFAFFTRLGNQAEKVLFPTNTDERPYTNKGPPLFPQTNDDDDGIEMTKRGGSKKAQKGGKSKPNLCGETVDFINGPIFNSEYMRNLYDYGAPYTWTEDYGEIQGSMAWFKGYIGNIVKGSYVMLRTVLGGIFETLQASCGVMPNTGKDLIPFILGPFAIPLLFAVMHFWFLPVLFGIFINEKTDVGLWVSIAGIFLMYTWLIAFGVSFIQSFGVLFTILFMPIISGTSDGINLRKIIGQPLNLWYLLVIYCILGIKSAKTYLSNELVWPVALGFLIIAGTSFPK